ncbi:MAG: DUF1343 domain-containing protein [Thermoanaerobaculia bacterium]
MTVRPGLEVLIEDEPSRIAGKRLGLVTNQSGVTRDVRHAVQLLHGGSNWKLTSLFGPEHGIWGEVQDMGHVDHSKDPLSGLPVYSLYGASESDLEPKRELLEGLDALIIDLQDVGSRYYTFVYTMALCMRAAARAGIESIVLDRPNPINGVQLEGNIREDFYSSFVGLFPLPVRHGMTAGELAKWFARYFLDHEKLECNLTVVPMKGWRRSMWWDETGLPWVIPSPNMPTVATATVYPGMCLIEGTNLSEGRGTTHPFEFFGAPWLESFPLADALNRLDLPGVRFRPHYFLPTFQKHADQVCGGVEMHVTDRSVFEPFRTGLWCVKVAREMNPEKFDWRRETYEYVSDRLAIDLLAGSAGYRELVESGGDIEEWIATWKGPLAEFTKQREEFLIYRE